MIINKIKLKNYRNYDDIELQLSDKLNIIIGDNAQGKTNLLESIYVLSITKSYLNVNDRNLIKFEKDFALLEADIVSNSINKNLRIVINQKGKNVLINNKEIKKLSNYISNLKVVIFSPDNIRMIKDGPGVRRKFLNVEISQLSDKYMKNLMDYNNIISQKNEYLKGDSSKDLRYLSILNDKICDLSVYISHARHKFINNLNTYIGNIFFEITGIKGLNVKYLSSVELDNDSIKNNFRQKLDKYLEKEQSYKISLVGPHRDDFIFVLNGKNLSLYGSQGQLRCAILSLKLAEVKIFIGLNNDYPVLLLDDIFSELDIIKKNNLIKYITDNVQTIITTTDINLIDEKLVKKANIFKISNAKLFPGK